MNREVLLVLFRIHKGIRVRVRGRRDECRLKKPVLRVYRSCRTQKNDLFIVSDCGISSSQGHTESQAECGFTVP